MLYTADGDEIELVYEDDSRCPFGQFVIPDGAVLKGGYEPWASEKEYPYTPDGEARREDVKIRV